MAVMILNRTDLGEEGILHSPLAFQAFLHLISSQKTCNVDNKIIRPISVTVHVIASVFHNREIDRELVELAI